MANVSGQWNGKKMTDEDYLSAQIAEHGIESVCNELHDQGEGVLANQVMVAYTRQIQKDQKEHMNKLKEYFSQLLVYCCDCCEGKDECEKHKLGMKQMKDGLAPLAVGALTSCELLRMRILCQTKENEPPSKSQTQQSKRTG